MCCTSNSNSVVIQTKRWEETEAQWISIKPEHSQQIYNLQQVFQQIMGDSFVLTPPAKLHITIFRGITSSLEFKQQKELMERVAEVFFEFYIEIDFSNTHVESKGLYITWHFNNDLIEKLQKKVQRVAVDFLRNLNPCYKEQEGRFNPHITLGVISTEYNPWDIKRHIDHGIYIVNSALRRTPSISFPVNELHLLGVNGLKLDIPDRIHHDLFVVIPQKQDILQIEQLINYATEENFNMYVKIYFELRGKLIKNFPFEFISLVEEFLKEESDEVKDNVYSALVKQQKKIVNENWDLDIWRERIILKELSQRKSCSSRMEMKIAEELDKKNLSIVRELILQEQPTNSTLYIKYLKEESDMTHVEAVFELVKNMSCVKDEIYEIFLRKLIHNKASIERIRIIFEEGCTFFKKSDVRFLSAYLDAERTLENGSLEKIKELYDKRNMMRYDYILYYCFFRVMCEQKCFKEAAEVCEEFIEKKSNIGKKCDNVSMWKYHFEWKLKKYKDFKEIVNLFNLFNSKFKKTHSGSKQLRTVYGLYILETKKFDPEKAFKIYQKAVTQKILFCEFDLLEEGLGDLWLPSNFEIENIV